MRHIAVIARNDLRVFLKNKAAYFWLFGSPLLFAVFMGMAVRGPGDPSNPRPSLAIENHDPGFMGRLLVEELGTQGLNVLETTNGAPRGVRIPANFTAEVLAKRPVKIQMYREEEAGSDAAAMVEFRLVRAIVALNSHLVEHSARPDAPTEESLREVLRRANPIALQASFATRKPIPAGYQQSVPGILVMFIMMNLLIFGGVSVASERREGVLRRLVMNPVSKRDLVAGKIFGLMLLGAVQIGFLLAAGTLFLGLNVGGNMGAMVLLMGVYAWVAAALGVLIGSVVSREDKVVAICVLAAMIMAALGGCWWPLEIVPDNVRAVGHIFPTAWAMDGLHQLISFGGDLADVSKIIAILAAYGMAASFGALRLFRV